MIFSDTYIDWLVKMHTVMSVRELAKRRAQRHEDGVYDGAMASDIQGFYGSTSIEYRCAQKRVPMLHARVRIKLYVAETGCRVRKRQVILVPLEREVMLPSQPRSWACPCHPPRLRLL